MKVPQEKALEVLKDSVIEGLEGGKKRSRFPVLHDYLEMEGEDIDNPTVRKLRDEFAQIQEALPTLHIGLYQNSKFVPVDYIIGRLYSANREAGFFLTSVGLPKDYPAREKLEELIRQSISMCDEAIRRECGFGKYTR